MKLPVYDFVCDGCESNRYRGTEEELPEDTRGRRWVRDSEGNLFCPACQERP